MSLVDKAFKGAAWLSLFRGSGQIISWLTTIVIARILISSDYGLMDMATIFTGYLSLFSELGLGSAIIQKKEVNENELSSLFWFIAFWGLILSFSCILLAYPTVAVFNEPRLLRITQSVAFLFLLSALIIVPRNLLQRELKFKTLGIIDSSGVVLSCIAMYIIAINGGGVWTLIGGHIVLQFVKFVATYLIVRWIPQFHFDFHEIKPYLKFGLNVAGSRSFRYVYRKSPKLFGGKILGANLLGFYSLAGNLASIPTQKIMTIISNVSFPVFSRYQNDPKEFKNFYLKLINFVSLLTFPIFIGGMFIADSLIPLVLGEKWKLAIIPFKLLCIGQLFQTLGIPDEIANNAQGRPHWSLRLNLIYFLVLTSSFFIAVKYGLNSLAVPWITVYPLIQLTFTWLTIKKIGVSLKEYGKSICHPIFATLLMLLILFSFRYFSLNSNAILFSNLKIYTSASIIIGALTYGIYVYFFQKSFILYFQKLRNK